MPGKILGSKRAPTIAQKVAMLKQATLHIVKACGKVDQQECFKAASTSIKRFQSIGYLGKVATLRFLPEVATELQKPIVQALLTLRARSSAASRDMHDKSMLYVKPVRISQRGCATWGTFLPRMSSPRADEAPMSSTPVHEELPLHLSLCCPQCKAVQRLVNPVPKVAGKWKTLWCTTCFAPWPANKWACSCNRLWATCALHFRWHGMRQAKRTLTIDTIDTIGSMGKARAMVFGDLAPDLSRNRNSECIRDHSCKRQRNSKIFQNDSPKGQRRAKSVALPQSARKRRKKCW